MRHLALALVLLGCSADPVIAPRDCTPGTTTSCACPSASGVQTCTAAGTVGACVCPDGGGGVDAVAVGDAAAPEDRPAPMDAVTTPDAATALDVVDAGALGTDVVDAGRCVNGPRAVCDGQSVSLQSGVRQDGGVTLHCGACGNACPAGTFCVACVCER